jgi:transcriptional regulator with XRE-family HTH domain
MPSGIDWPSIRQKFEQGISQRSLAKEYGIRQATISEYATKEGWQKFSRISPIPDRITDTPLDTLDSSDSTSIANFALSDLANHLSGTPEHAKLQLTQHKLFADSFSQYVKAKLLLPSDKPIASGIDSTLLPYLTIEELAEMSEYRAKEEAILEVARSRKLESETGIRSIKKTG